MDINTSRESLLEGKDLNIIKIFKLKGTNSNERLCKIKIDATCKCINHRTVPFNL